MGIKDYLRDRVRRALGIVALEEQNRQIQATLEQLLAHQRYEYVRELVTESKAGSVLTCRINHLDLLAPVEPLQAYQHCLQPLSQQKLNYAIETHCSDWLRSHLQPGDTVLDIGAAFGVITLPLADAVGQAGHVYAFEPAHRTQKLLEKILELNGMTNVTLVPAAISDRMGSAEFIEYTPDNELSWAPDTSSLMSEAGPQLDKHLRYSVEVTTIDEFVSALGIQPKAIKMDIEGFELYALQGGKITLEKYSPYLCVDIHKDVRTGESALVDVEPLLKSYGYEVQMQGHTLFGTPKGRIG